MNTNIQSNNLNFSTSKNTTNSSNTINTGTSLLSNTNFVSNNFHNVSPEVEIMDLSTMIENTEDITLDIIKSTANWIVDINKYLFATNAVLAKSVYNGVANIGEGLADGLVWCGGKIVEGASFLGGKVAGWFSDEAEQSVMEWREQAKTDIKEYIKTDIIGEANERFYKESSLGQWINDNSYLKYDSKGAQFITKGTEVVGKIATATAATVVTGGAAAPLTLGFLSGSGEQSEKIYQNNTDTTGAQELGIFVSGLGEAANWYAQGKLGEGVLNLSSSLKQFITMRPNEITTKGVKEAGASLLKNMQSKIKKDGIISSSKQVLNKVGNTFKNVWQSISKDSMKASMMAADNLADSAGIIGDNVSDWLIGEEEFNLTNALKASGELGAAWLLNMGMDSISDYFIKAKVNENDLLFNTNDENSNLKNIKYESALIGGLQGNKKANFGVDQNAVRKLFTLERKNNDWIKSDESFRNFLRKEYPNLDNYNLEVKFLSYKMGEKYSMNNKDLIIKYIQSYEPNLSKALLIYKNSFDYNYTDEINHLIKKYEKQGLSTSEAINMLSSIDTTGVCSYAAVANEIVESYIDAPDAFKRDFGFPLYITDETGHKVLNSAELLADMYVFANTRPNGSLFSRGLNNKLSIVHLDYSKQTYLSGFGIYRHDLINAYLKSKSPKLEYRCYGNSYSNNMLFYSMGTDFNRLATYDIGTNIRENLSKNRNVTLGINSNINNPYTFYRLDGTEYISTLNWKEGNGHAVFVTDIDDEYVYISSWGEQLKIKISNFANNGYSFMSSQIANINKVSEYTIRKGNNWMISEESLKKYLRELFTNASPQSIDKMYSTLTTSELLTNNQVDIIVDYLFKCGYSNKKAQEIFYSNFKEMRVENFVPKSYARDLVQAIPPIKKECYENAGSQIISMFENKPTEFKEAFGYEITDEKSLIGDLFDFVNSDTYGGRIFENTNNIRSLLTKDFSKVVDLSPNKCNLDKIIQDFINSKIKPTT